VLTTKKNKCWLTYLENDRQIDDQNRHWNNSKRRQVQDFSEVVFDQPLVVIVTLFPIQLPVPSGSYHSIVQPWFRVSCDILWYIRYDNGRHRRTVSRCSCLAGSCNTWVARAQNRFSSTPNRSRQIRNKLSASPESSGRDQSNTVDVPRTPKIESISYIGYAGCFRRDQNFYSASA